MGDHSRKVELDCVPKVNKAGTSRGKSQPDDLEPRHSRGSRSTSVRSQGTGLAHHDFHSCRPPLWAVRELVVVEPWVEAVELVLAVALILLAC